MKKLIFAASFAMLIAACNAPQSSTNVVSESILATDLAYVNIERVLTESDIFKNEGVVLQQRTETSQRDWAQKEQQIQNDAVQLQQKYQNGLITTANAQKEQEKIEARVEAFRMSTQDEMQKLEEENSVFANRTQALIKSAVSNVNKAKKYRMIVDASALLDADSTLDISDVVLKELNDLYKKEK